ncbi:MAG: four-carbon acid sugar kinase family protein, partial [Chloroflexi bacterium]|nr:four-carbon acid sugar kinase family protein [Chloroflexota bacterium]
MTLAILADDLTGACDAAAPFAAQGLVTVVVLDPLGGAAPRFDDVVVRAIDADTRRLSFRRAAARTVAVAELERTGGARSLYKKVDSTLRGHV